MTDKVILKSLDGTVEVRDMTTEEQATQDAFK